MLKDVYSFQQVSGGPKDAVGIEPAPWLLCLLGFPLLCIAFFVMVDLRVVFAFCSQPVVTTSFDLRTGWANDVNE